MALFILSGCKVKQKSIVKTDSTTVSHKAVHSDSAVSHIDTSSYSHYAGSVVIQSGTMTTTETGTFKDGQLDGPGTKTIVKTNRSKNTHTDNQIDKSGIIDHSEIKTDSTVSDSTHVKTKSKTVSVGPDHTWLILAGIAGMLYFIISIFETKKSNN